MPGQTVSKAIPATGLMLLSLSDGSIQRTAKVGFDPVAVIVSADGATAFLADSAPGDVYGVELPSLSVRWKQHVGGAPFGLLIRGGSLYVSLFNSAAIVELNPADGSELARHTVPAGPAVMTLDGEGRVVVAGTRGNISYLDGSMARAGHGFGIAVAHGTIWTADYERAEIVRAVDGRIIGMPDPVFPFWLSASADGRVLIAAEGGAEDTDPGGIYAFDPASSAFVTLGHPKDPDQILQSDSSVFVAAHGDQEVLAIRGGKTETWAHGAGVVALAPDPSLRLLVVAVNAHE